MKKIALFIGGATVALAVAAPVHADASSFLDYLEDQGLDTSGTEYEAINLGHAICDLFDAGGDAMDAMDTLRSPDKATWVVGAVHYMCPQYGNFCTEMV